MRMDTVYTVVFCTVGDVVYISILIPAGFKMIVSLNGLLQNREIQGFGQISQQLLTVESKIAYCCAS